MQVMDLIFFLSPSDYFFTQLILDFRVPVKFTLLRSDATHIFHCFHFSLSPRCEDYSDVIPKLFFFYVFKCTPFGYKGLIENIYMTLL